MLTFIIVLCSVLYFYLRTNFGDINNYDGVSVAIVAGKLLSIGLTFMIYNDTDEELIFSEEYILERKVMGKWYKVLYKPSMMFQSVGWEDNGIIVKEKSTQTMEVNWEWLYGNLSKGNYRMVKKFITKYPESYNLSLEFTIS